LLTFLSLLSLTLCFVSSLCLLGRKNKDDNLELEAKAAISMEPLDITTVLNDDEMENAAEDNITPYDAALTKLSNGAKKSWEEDSDSFSNEWDAGAIYCTAFCNEAVKTQKRAIYACFQIPIEGTKKVHGIAQAQRPDVNLLGNALGSVQFTPPGGGNRRSRTPPHDRRRRY
jgi:hypothetical protein